MSGKPLLRMERWSVWQILRVRSIGEAAQLEINSHGTAFVARRERRTAPPIAPNDSPATLMAETAE
jgi:hypothetical protein